MSTVNANIKANVKELADSKGATVIDIQRDGHKVIVLCEWRGEFVTWVYGEGSFFWGHYYTDLKEAVNGFCERANLAA